MLYYNLRTAIYLIMLTLLSTVVLKCLTRMQSVGKLRKLGVYFASDKMHTNTYSFIISVTILGNILEYRYIHNGSV